MRGVHRKITNAPSPLTVYVWSIRVEIITAIDTIVEDVAVTGSDRHNRLLYRHQREHSILRGDSYSSDACPFLFYLPFLPSITTT